MVTREEAIQALKAGDTKTVMQHIREQKGETLLPDDWEPTKNHHRIAAKLGVDIDVEEVAFRAHAERNGRVQKSWNGAFSTWLANARRYQKQDQRQTRATDDGTYGWMYE